MWQTGVGACVKTLPCEGISVCHRHSTKGRLLRIWKRVQFSHLQRQSSWWVGLLMSLGCECRPRNMVWPLPPSPTSSPLTTLLIMLKPNWPSFSFSDAQLSVPAVASPSTLTHILTSVNPSHYSLTHSFNKYLLSIYQFPVLGTRGLSGNESQNPFFGCQF